MKMKHIKVFMFFLASICISYGDGNEDNFELGSAIYRDFEFPGSNNHWHGGIFSYFEYGNGFGTIYYVEAGGIGDDVSHRQKPTTTDPKMSISISNYEYDISQLKLDLKNYFKDNNDDYNGTFTVNSTSPSKREDIVATSRDGGLRGTSYTWIDMLDVENHWCWDHFWMCEHWDGTIGDIDEIRCDGVIEFSYEENGVMVSNFADIGSAGNGNVSLHNQLHEFDHNFPELCPKIQAGESHFGGEWVSEFDPLIAGPPISNNFTSNQYNEYNQLGFRVSDNASVKSYVLLQVKKTSETTWHTLKDKNNNIWKFKSVDLTDYSGGYQYDYFYVPWNGKYESGYASAGTFDYQLKIVVIDQGANHSETIHNFTATIPELEVTISGPSQLYPDGSEPLALGSKGGTVINAPPTSASGTWTANATGGVGDYTYQWYKKSGITWYDLPNQTSPDLTYTISDDTEFKCIVNSGGQTNFATKFVEFMGIAPLSSFTLGNNYPNPFNPSTKIYFTLPTEEYVELIIFDVIGRKVKTLHSGTLETGLHEITWNGTNEIGQSVSSGVYIYSIKAYGKMINKKMFLFR